MFGFGMTFCVLGDHRVAKREALPVIGRRDVGVCHACREKWERAGSRCARCKAPVRGGADLGLFVDRYAFGHRDCGATALPTTPLARV